MVYHVLPEAETFSEHRGGAISRWCANVLRADGNGRIVCAEADATWGFGSDAVVVVRLLLWYRRVLRFARGRMPWRYRLLMCRAIFAGLVSRVRAGDVIYIHNRPELVSVFRALLGSKRVAIALHMHNSHLATYPRKVAGVTEAALTLFCSRFLEDEARRRFLELGATAVIANGADPRLFFPSQPSVDSVPTIPTILFVGRLVPEKGAHVFIEALRLLEHRGTIVWGKVVGSAEFGSSPQTAYSRRLQLDAGARIEFAAYVSGSALAAQYRSATIFCCPSVWNEAFGMVNVEAMATRLPVVATDVGGVRDIFSNGGALLVPPNAADKLADAIEQLVCDPPLRETLAAAGYRAFMERFDWSIIAERYRELIAQLLEPASYSVSVD